MWVVIDRVRERYGSFDRNFVSRQEAKKAQSDVISQEDHFATRLAALAHVQRHEVGEEESNNVDDTTTDKSSYDSMFQQGLLRTAASHDVEGAKLLQQRDLDGAFELLPEKLMDTVLWV